MDIYISSLPFKLKELFQQYGEVTSVTIVIDNITRQNKGFGFVKMPIEKQAYKAIKELNGTELIGRTIIVSKSEGKKDNKRRR